MTAENADTPGTAKAIHPWEMLLPRVASSYRGRSRTPVSAPSGSTFCKAESYRQARADGEIQPEKEMLRAHA